MLYRKSICIFLLFTLIVTAIMAPIASHSAIPSGDYIYHLENIMLAHQAILQGAFPLRTAPGGWFYPVFQFYAPFTYTLAGLLSFISHNPMDPFKLAIGLCLILGAWYSYKLYIFLFHNEIAALLGAILYLFSPYLLTNINVRGDFTEAISQGLLPIGIYYVFRLFNEANWNSQKYYFFLVNIFVFYVLATSHLITFLYGSLFLFILILTLAIYQKTFKNFLIIAISCGLGCVLAAWYLIPVATYAHILNIGANGLSSPWAGNWLTGIATLLSPKGVSPSPLLIQENLPLYPGLGISMSISFIYWGYQFYIAKATPTNHKQLIKSVFWIFFIVFIMLWSPVNFWKFLPHQFYVLQYTYRLLTDIMWLGGILFVAMLIDVFKEGMNKKHFILGGFCIALASTQWMYNNYNSTSGNLPILLPQNYLGTKDYLIDTASIPSYSSNPNLINLAVTKANCHEEQLSSICTLDIKTANQAVQLPILYYPKLLKITANDKEMAYSPSNATNNITLASINLNPGHYVIISKFRGLSSANTLSEIAWGLYILSLICFLIFRRKQGK